jgi:hypothetical protein
MNMKSVLAWWKSGKDCLYMNSGNNILKGHLALYEACIKDGNCHFCLVPIYVVGHKIRGKGDPGE